MTHVDYATRDPDDPIDAKNGIDGLCLLISRRNGMLLEMSTLGTLQNVTGIDPGVGFAKCYWNQQCYWFCEMLLESVP